MHGMMTSTLALQKAMMEASMTLTQAMLENYVKLLEQMCGLHHLNLHRRDDDDEIADLLNPPARKRHGGMRAGHHMVSPCCGADLKDHYGKRAHDVDVERI